LFIAVAPWFLADNVPGSILGNHPLSFQDGGTDFYLKDKPDAGGKPS
jgi:hypothetical protein